MAIAHCSIKNGLAGKGAAHALYVQGIGRYAARADVAFIEHGNMPAFASVDPQAFWRAADENERANGRAYREVEFAIPRELNDGKEQIKFAQRFTDRIIGVGHAYTLAIHDKEAADGGRNVHAHLMFTERKNDGIERDAVQFFKRANPKQPEKGGAGKDRAFNSREFVKKTRELYGKVVNRELEARGVEPISMDRNDEREPEPKLGPQHPRAQHDERRAARLKKIEDLRGAREAHTAIQQELKAVESEILDLSNDLAAALAARKAALPVKPKPQPASREPSMTPALLARAKAKEIAVRQATPATVSAPAQDPRIILSGRLEKDGYGVQPVKTERQGGYAYTGGILLVTDLHLAQDLGRKVAVIHDRSALAGDAKVGDYVDIKYDAGVGTVTQRSLGIKKGRKL